MQYNNQHRVLKLCNANTPTIKIPPKTTTVYESQVGICPTSIIQQRCIIFGYRLQYCGLMQEQRQRRHRNYFQAPGYHVDGRRYGSHLICRTSSDTRHQAQSIRANLSLSIVNHACHLVIMQHTVTLAGRTVQYLIGPTTIPRNRILFGAASVRRGTDNHDVKKQV